MGEARRYGPERNRQGVEVAPSDEVSAKHSRVEQRARLTLDDCRALDSETMLALLPYDEGLQDPERAGGERLVGAEEIGEGDDARQRVELTTRVATGIEGSDNGPHAGADHEIGPNAQTVERAQDADVRESLGPTAREDELARAIESDGQCCVNRAGNGENIWSILDINRRGGAEADWCADRVRAA